MALATPTLTRLPTSTGGMGMGMADGTSTAAMDVVMAPASKRPVGRPRKVSQRSAGQLRRWGTRGATLPNVPRKVQSRARVHSEAESPHSTRESKSQTRVIFLYPEWIPVYPAGSLHGPVYSRYYRHEGVNERTGRAEGAHWQGPEKMVFHDDDMRATPVALYERTWG